MELTLSELEITQQLLLAMSKTSLPCAYHISVNLRLIEKILKEEHEAIRQEFMRLCDKNEAGEPAKYLRRVGYEANVDDPNNYFEVNSAEDITEEYKDETKWHKEIVMRISAQEDLDAYNLFRDTAYNEKHKIEFKMIPESKIIDADIPAEIIAPLIGVCIEDVTLTEA